MGIIAKMKMDAMKSGAKIQTEEARKLEIELNNLFFLDKNIEEETAFVKHVMTRGMETQERVGLHASAMLVSDKDFCLRAQVLSLFYKQSQGEDISVGLKRIFEEGNAIHEKWQRLFIRGGFAKAKTCDRTRLCEEYSLTYTPDIVSRIPNFYDGALPIEIKSVNTFQFKKMTKHPSAWKQIQWYMHLCIKAAKLNGNWNGKDYKKGIVLNEDKNTQEFKTEVHAYDPTLIEKYIDRAEEIAYHRDKFVNKGLMVKRPQEATSSNSKKCEKCFMKLACWNIDGGRVRIEEKRLRNV